MRISDWSSDVCSSDLLQPFGIGDRGDGERDILQAEESGGQIIAVVSAAAGEALHLGAAVAQPAGDPETVAEAPGRSEEHTSELQSLMRISYAVFCLKKKNTKQVTSESKNHKRH